mmetsp:Transcript_71344/g.123816  ORF Transcript_71344/g.123816 Transcript_71344/m.123816 type:complete len:158 (-) Transcript_71344:22-495(-)
MISLSLGETRNLQVKANDAEFTEKPAVDMPLRAGDLISMEGLMQRHYKHQVPKGAKNLKGRISLTWCWVLQHRRPCVHASNIGSSAAPVQSPAPAPAMSRPDGLQTGMSSASASDSLGPMIVVDRSSTCAGGCGFMVHSDPEFGGFCCRACAWLGSG